MKSDKKAPKNILIDTLLVHCGITDKSRKSRLLSKKNGTIKRILDHFAKEKFIQEYNVTDRDIIIIIWKFYSGQILPTAVFLFLNKIMWNQAKYSEFLLLLKKKYSNQKLWLFFHFRFFATDFRFFATDFRFFATDQILNTA